MAMDQGIDDRVTVFEKTLYGSHCWVRDIQNQINWLHYDEVYQLLRAVLHTLRDQMGISEAARFSSKLPLLLKGTFFESWNPSNQRNIHSENEFTDLVEQKMHSISKPRFILEQGIRAVLNKIQELESIGAQ